MRAFPDYSGGVHTLHRLTWRVQESRNPGKVGIGVIAHNARKIGCARIRSGHDHCPGASGGKL